MRPHLAKKKAGAFDAPAIVVGQRVKPDVTVATATVEVQAEHAAESGDQAGKASTDDRPGNRNAGSRVAEGRTLDRLITRIEVRERDRGRIRGRYQQKS